MRDWFKARNIWGAAITALSDEEAGRLAKAIWAFTMNGEILPIDGAGKGILAMILLTLGQDAERDGEISEKRSLAGKSGALATNAIKSHQMTANASKCRQMSANADNKNKNKNIDIEQEKESESFIGDAEAHRIQTEQDRLLDAAEDAGFRMSNDVRASLIAFYADYGLEKLLAGLKSCVKHGAPNLAYLEAVMKGKPKQAKAVVPAQDFEQRDYSSIQDGIMDRQSERIRAFLEKKQEVG